MGTVTDAAIIEASGLASSRTNPGVLWVHNDSGNAADLFALNTRGKLLGSYHLKDGSCIDWEDITIGPGPTATQDYLYIADAGTNRNPRPEIVLRRMLEPRVDPRMQARLAPIDAESFRITYPDESVYDAETLMADPRDGSLYIVTKSKSGMSRVFRTPAPAVGATELTLRPVTTLRFGDTGERGSPRATGGDISRDGSLVLIKTYTHAYLWRRGEGQSVKDALAASPCVAPLKREPQGESLAFAADGSGYFTLSEGASQPLHFVARSGK